MEEKGDLEERFYSVVRFSHSSKAELHAPIKTCINVHKWERFLKLGSLLVRKENENNDCTAILF